MFGHNLPLASMRLAVHKFITEHTSEGSKAEAKSSIIVSAY